LSNNNEIYYIVNPNFYANTRSDPLRSSPPDFVVAQPPHSFPAVVACHAPALLPPSSGPARYGGTHDRPPSASSRVANGGAALTAGRPEAASAGGKGEVRRREEGRQRRRGRRPLAIVALAQLLLLPLAEKQNQF